MPNLKRLTIVCVVFVLLSATVNILHGLQQGRRVEVMAGEISRAREAGDPRKLISALKRYLLIRPEDLKAQSELINLLADHAATGDALLDVYYQFQAFLKNQPDDLVHRERLIKIAQQLGEHQDVLTNLEYVSTKMDLTPEMLVWKGASQQKIGDIEGAIKSYRAAIEQDPAQIPAYIELATILRRNLEAFEESAFWIRRLTEANPESTAAHLAQARYYLDIVDLPAAQASVEAALNLKEDFSEGVLLWSEIVMISRQRTAGDVHQSWEARDAEIVERLARAWETDPAEAQFPSKLSAFALRRNDPAEAERLLRQGLERAPGNPLLRWELADLAISRGQFESVPDHLRELTSAGVKRGLIDYLRGRILLRDQQWHEASRCFLRARGDVEPSPRLSAQVDLYLAEAYAELGDSDLRLTSCHRAVQTQPFFVAAREHLARALLAVGRVDEALIEYRTMLELPDAPAYGWTPDVGWATVAKVLIVRNLSVPENERRWEDLDPVLESLSAAAAADSIEAVLLKAEVLASRKETVKARELLQAVPEQRTKDVRWWVALINLSLRDGDLDRAVSLLADAERSVGQHVELKRLDAILAVYRSDTGHERLAEIARESTDWPDADRVRLLYELASLYSNLGRPDDAEAIYAQIIQLTPHDIRIWLLQFDAAMNRTDLALCRKCLDALRVIEGRNGSYSSLAEAFLILRNDRENKDARQLEAARRTLIDLQVRRPRWSRVPWALAMLDELDGRREHAAENFMRAFDLGDRSPELVRHTLTLLHELHRYDLAEELIHQWEKTPNAPILPEINRMAAEILLERENPQQALQRAHRAVSANSSNFQDHLWLAQIHRAGGETAKAEAAFRTAVRLAPQAGAAWVALMRHLLREQRNSEAEALLPRIRAEAPLDRQPAILAVCLEALGQLPEAEREYLRAVESAPDDLSLLQDAAEFLRRVRKLADSERLWRKLLELNSSRTTTDRCVARRGLAAVLATRGDYPGFKEALALVEQNLKELPRSTIDLRAKSTLLAMRGDPQQRRESAELFQKLAREEPLSGQDQSLLAALHESNGDLSRAHEVWQVLVASQTTNPVYLSRYISVLLKRHDKSDAQVWLERLREVAPDWQATLELQAEYWLLEGQTQDVIDIFRRHVAAAADNDARARRCVEMGEALERLARTHLRNSAEQRGELMTAAEGWFREYAKLDSSKRHVLGAFLARTGRTEEALNLIDQSWESVSPAILSSLLATSLPMADPSPDVLAEAAEKIVRHLPDPPVTSMWNDLAVLEEGQQHFDQAEMYYRKVLAREPDNVVALNNLAFLLALQDRKLEEAAKLIEKAIDSAGPAPALLDTRAQVALAAGKLEAARSDREAVARQTPSPASWFRLAIVYQQLKDQRKLREAAVKARNGGLQPGEVHFLERRFLDPVMKAADDAA